jgi:AcrR family transcriptional regulator
MPRPPNPDRRARTLARATDYVLEHGLAGLSLRPLAAALGTSARMLLYDFGTKEQLIGEVLAEARRREAALLVDYRSTPGSTGADTLRFVWQWISAEERKPFVRLFFEVYVDAFTHPERYPGGAGPMVADWLAVVRDTWTSDGGDPAGATLLIAVVRGLLLDRMAATDPTRTDEALDRFASLLGRRHESS